MPPKTLAAKYGAPKGTFAKNENYFKLGLLYKDIVSVFAFCHRSSITEQHKNNFFPCALFHLT